MTPKPTDSFHKTRLPRAAEAKAALEGNFWGLWSRFGRGEDCQLHDRHGATWFETPISSMPYNSVIRFQNPADQIETAVDHIIDSYASREVPITWIVHPSSPPGLPAVLQQRGFALAETVEGMWADLSELPPPDRLPSGWEIRAASPGAEVNALLDLVSWRWDVAAADRPLMRKFLQAFEVGARGSPIQCWAAWQDGQPMAKALLNLDDGVAGIYGVSTRPEARGRGLARLLTLTALHFARDQGYKLGVLHSSPMAISLYTKIGFKPAQSQFKVYISSGYFHI